MYRSFIFRRPAALLGSAAVLASVAIAGCGSSGSSTTSAGTDSGSSTMPGMDMSSGSTSGTTTMPSDHSSGTSAMSSSSSTKMAPGSTMAPLAMGADGLKATAAGLTLRPATLKISASGTTRWSFQIVKSNGSVLTDFERDQTKLLHLIVAKRDLSAYQHLHPTLAKDGTFSIPLTVGQAGTFRAIADFTTSGKRHVLGIDVVAPGASTAKPLPAEAASATTDGYDVSMQHGRVNAGGETTMTFAVMKNGRPVTDLQPYLGAYGHLVALREGTLAYSHVHPTADDRAKGTIRFATELETAGTYRLFLQFRAMGSVHTAAFTVKAS